MQIRLQLLNMNSLRPVYESFCYICSMYVFVNARWCNSDENDEDIRGPFPLNTFQVLMYRTLKQIAQVNIKTNRLYSLLCVVMHISQIFEAC